LNKTGCNFNLRKATQALTFFALKEGRVMNKMKALKLFYLADRFHLRKYGRLISNDIYFAMEYGPVPSSTKDIAENSAFLSGKERSYSEHYIKPVDAQNYKAVSAYDADALSASDLEALEHVWKNFGRYDQFKLVDITHEFPEWKKHKIALEIDPRIEMDLFDFLDESGTAQDKFFKLRESGKESIKEELREQYYLESLWK